VGVRLVSPASLMRPVGFSHAAVGSGKAIHLAGQIGADASGKVVDPDDLPRQVARALDNLVVALRAAGGEPGDLAMVRIFTTDVPGYRAHLREIGKIWRDRIGRHFPAMVLVGVSQLYDPGAKIEIEGVAYVG